MYEVLSAELVLCTHALGTGFNSADIHRDNSVLIDFIMAHWLHARMKFNGVSSVYTRVQKGNAGQNQQGLAKISPVLFHPHLFTA